MCWPWLARPKGDGLCSTSTVASHHLYYAYFSPYGSPCLVINNFKVMYMTLHTLPQLHYCTLRKAVRVALLSRSPLNAYWLVRDPYQRLQSCFRDKLRAMPERMARWVYQRKTWRRPLSATLADRLLWQLRGLAARLHPASIPGVKLHILKMEDSDDLALLGRAINCDLGERKSNATTHLRVDTRYSRQSLAIVNEIYREDFCRLGYAMHSEPEQFKALAYPA